MQMFYYLLLFFLGSINPAFAQEAYQAHTHVKLVSEQDAVVPGGTFWVGIDLLLERCPRTEPRVLPGGITSRGHGCRVAPCLANCTGRC